MLEDEGLAPAGQPIVEETKVDQPQEAPVNQSQDPTEPKVDPNTPSVTTEEPEDNNVLRTLRAKYNKIKEINTNAQKTLALMAKREGCSVEELNSRLQKQQDAADALKNNISPEVQASLRQQQEELAELKQARIMDSFKIKEQAFRNKYPEVTNKEMLAFATEAQNRGIDILKQGVDIEAAYRAINYDKLVAKARSEAKAAALAELKQSQQSAPNMVHPAGSAIVNQGDTKGIEDLIALSRAHFNSKK